MTLWHLLIESGPGTGIFLPFGMFTAFETCSGRSTSTL